MKPFSNKVTVTLLLAVLGLLAYFLVVFYTVISGFAPISDLIYPLYMTIEILIIVIASIAILIALELRWDSRQYRGEV